MSIAIVGLINRASVLCADPSNRRTSRDEHLLNLNIIQGELAIKARCIEVDSDFDITAGTFEYPYPSNAVSLSGIRYSETPDDVNTFTWLKEKFRDEWRRMTDGNRAEGNPWAYYARTRSFEIMGTPTVSVPGGGIATYSIKADALVTETGSVLAVPDFLEDVVVDGMVILARMGTRDRVAASQDYAKWRENLMEIREQIEDRSDDRRPAIRSPGMDNPYGGMV